MRVSKERLDSLEDDYAIQDVLYHRARLTKIVGADSGKLSGKTLAIKDNIHIAGVPLCCGSNFMRGFISSHTATVVSRILHAGHIL